MSARLVEVAPGVLVATSRFMATNTVVLTSGPDALVVDPGVHDDELAALADELHARKLAPVAGVATHAHWDHLLWHEGLGDVPRYATPVTVERANANRDDIVGLASLTTSVDVERLGLVTPADTVHWSGPDPVFVTHDAHEPGHTALHLPERRLLVAGDMTSDVEVPLLEPDVDAPAALASYRAGLDRIAALADVEVVVPGHGAVCDRRTWLGRIDADRRYLDTLAAGHPSRDDRLVARWMVDADRAMRQQLSKAAWRSWADTLPEAGADEMRAVAAHLDSFLATRRGVVAAYSGIAGEVDISSVVAGRSDVALPRIAGDSVTWHRADGPLERHRHGMLQPAADAPFVSPDSFTTVLVPGRAFDRHGIRLGRGGGHYDRLVPALGASTAVVGVTTDARVLPRVPTEPHDAPMTHLATESGVRPVER